jgi:hypothetical protein
VKDSEQIRDDALAEGMDCEYMRIVRDIDDLISECSDTSYGKGQKVVLGKLKERIDWTGGTK